jgi:hypothetical protein
LQPVTTTEHGGLDRELDIAPRDFDLWGDEFVRGERRWAVDADYEIVEACLARGNGLVFR